MLIGVSGAKRSGKDTLGSVLIEQFGYEKVSFAAPLKLMVGTLYDYIGLTDAEIAERLEGVSKDANDPALLGISPRHLMVTLGTEWGREQVSKKIWEFVAEARILKLRAEGKTNIVLTDCRFDNEVELINRLGGTTVLVRRAAVEPDMSRWARIKRFLTGKRLHASELLWSRAGLFATTLYNNDTLENFTQRVRSFALQVGS